MRHRFRLRERLLLPEWVLHCGLWHVDVLHVALDLLHELPELRRQLLFRVHRLDRLVLHDRRGLYERRV